MSAQHGRRLPKRRPVEPEITQAVMDARGPSDKAKMLWLKLWSYRSKLDQIRDRSQAELAGLLGYSERSLRRTIETAGQFWMLKNHAGLNGNESLYQLYRPHQWRTERYTGPVAVRPPRRSPGLAPGSPHESDTSGRRTPTSAIAALDWPDRLSSPGPETSETAPIRALAKSPRVKPDSDTARVSRDPLETLAGVGERAEPSERRTAPSAVS